MLGSLRGNWKNILLAIMMTASIAACGAPAGNAENGQRWYAMNNCSACHGINANDGRAMNIRSLDTSFASFVHVLRKPYSPSMPKFSEQKISKQDAADIYAWLKSLK